MTTPTIRFSFAAVLAAALFLSGCRNGSKRVQEAWSTGRRYFAFVQLDPGSAVVGGDWYGVGLSEGPPTWHGVFRRYVGVCTLQGTGKLRISWAAPRELVVTCTDCDRKEFFIDERAWKGVTIKYEFKQTEKSSVVGSQDRRRLPPPNP